MTFGPPTMVITDPAPWGSVDAGATELDGADVEEEAWAEATTKTPPASKLCTPHLLAPVAALASRVASGRLRAAPRSG
ncbi:MAG: hypothetical protein ACP5P1_07900 [Acidimicrobiales bacterium]